MAAPLTAVHSSESSPQEEQDRCFPHSVIYLLQREVARGLAADLKLQQLLVKIYVCPMEKITSGYHDILGSVRSYMCRISRDK